MNILLTTSAAPLTSPFSTDEKRPPLGLGFLISVLRNAGHEVFFIDNYLHPSDFLERDYLIANQIDCVGIYANTICYRDTRRMLNGLQSLRERELWKGEIIVGGPHTSADLESIPDFVDHIVIGEGERAILDIVSDCAPRTVQAPLIEDLDELPSPAWDYFVHLPYDFTADWISVEPVFTMNTSRGCPFQCTFCSVASVWGRRYRYFSAERVLSDVKYLIEKYGAKGIYFREDNFSANRGRVIEFCNGLLEQGINVQWMCETRVDSLDRELIGLMHKAGCVAFYIGVESGSQRVLDFLRKGITTEQIEAVFRWCNEIGVNTYASFIVGVPTETPEERQLSREFARKIQATTAWFNIFVGIPKSPLYEYVLEHDLYEYIDDVGLVYMKGHDALVDQFYGGDFRRKMPVPSHYRRSQELLLLGKRRESLLALFRAILRHPLQLEFWKFLLVSFIDRRVVSLLRRIKYLF
jgi:radical SAM superfamily enzyme YgiQ (UPF0313 family)